MLSMNALPTGPGSQPSAEQIASALLEVRARQQSEHRWLWGTIVCWLVMALGAMTIAAAPFLVVLPVIKGEPVVLATIQAAIWLAILISAWWGHRFAWSNAFPRASTATRAPHIRA